jgi:TetR/AcrR family tetracycline transcriptional repressor
MSRKAGLRLRQLLLNRPSRCSFTRQLWPGACRLEPQRFWPRFGWVGGIFVRRASDRESPRWAAAFGGGLCKILLAYRDGARMVAGSCLTNTEYMKTVERIGAAHIARGFSVRRAVVLLSTIYNYTQSFVMKEQAVFPRPNERSPRYDLTMRNGKLDPKEFPILRQSGPIMFDKFERRYREGLDLILRGAK